MQKNKTNDLKKIFSINGFTYEEIYESTSVEYERPNQLQSKYFGVTVVPKKKTYRSKMDKNMSLENYLDFLNGAVDRSLYNGSKSIKKIYQSVNDEIELLNNMDINSKEYADKYYDTINNIGMFVDAFIDFLLICHNFYSVKDVDYYDEYVFMDSSGDKMITKCDKLIEKGLKICYENLLDNIFDKELADEKRQMIIDSLNNNTNVKTH